MTDTLLAVLGIVIVLAIVLVACRLARQARRRSESAYATEVPGSMVESPRRPGMSVAVQTLRAQHTSTRMTWDVASHGGDGPT